MNPKHSSKRLLSYEQAVDILNAHLEQIDNIHAFCMDHKLPYTRVIAIRNSYIVHYPRVLKQLLEIFGHEVEITTAFFLKS